MNPSPEVIVVLMSLAVVTLVTACVWAMSKAFKTFERRRRSSKKHTTFAPKVPYFDEDFYNSKIRDQGFESNVELSKRSHSYTVRIYVESIEIEVSWLSNTLIEVYTHYPKHSSLPFDIVQSNEPNPNPTGDNDFDQRFCIHKSSSQPSAPIREILKKCSTLETHQKVLLNSTGIVSTIKNSLDVPFEELIRLHCAFFKTYAQNPNVLDLHAEHQSIAVSARQ